MHIQQVSLVHRRGQKQVIFRPVMRHFRFGYFTSWQEVMSLRIILTGSLKIEFYSTGSAVVGEKPRFRSTSLSCEPEVTSHSIRLYHYFSTISDVIRKNVTHWKFNFFTGRDVACDKCHFLFEDLLCQPEVTSYAKKNHFMVEKSHLSTGSGVVGKEKSLSGLKIYFVNRKWRNTQWKITFRLKNVTRQPELMFFCTMSLPINLRRSKIPD